MSRVIGIDLGTTNTAVAVLDGGRPRILEDDRGYKVLPSVVSAKGEGRFIVGQAAHNLIITSPEKTVYATKRLIGRRFDSPEVQRVLTRVQYKLRPAEDGSVQMLVGDQWMSPTEVAAVILQVARGIAERALKDTVSDSVITVPAYFNHAQRKATLEAAQLAGLPCERLLNEPTAAALAYGLKKNIERTILLFDLGGGTFDVSVLKLTSGIYETLSTSGDTFLGGEDFDYRVVDHLLDQFQARTGIDVRQDRAALQRVKDAAERAKCELSFSDRTNVVIPQLAQGKSLETELTRLALESVTADLIDRCLQIARTAVADAGLSLSDIEDVILVGGQTRMPKVREAVTGVFGRDPSRTVHPEEVVAIGAAVHAANLEGGEASSTVLLDVTPFDLGIDAAGGMFVPIVSRNSRLPASESKVFATVSDNQETVRVTVRQGDSRTSAQNELLGEFVLEGLAPAPRLQTKVDVTFRIDTNGMLHVAAVERGTGEKKQISIRNFAERALAPQFPNPEQALAQEEARKAEQPAAGKPKGKGAKSRRSLVDVLLGRGRGGAKAPGKLLVAPVEPAVADAAALGATAGVPAAEGPGVDEAVLASVAAGVVSAGAVSAGMVSAGAASAGAELAASASAAPVSAAPVSAVPVWEVPLTAAEALAAEDSELYFGEGGEDGDGLMMDPLDEMGLVNDLGPDSPVHGLGPIEEEVYGDVEVGLGLAGGFGVGAVAPLQAGSGLSAGSLLDGGGDLLDAGGDLALSDLFGRDGLDDVEVVDPFAPTAPATAGRGGFDSAVGDEIDLDLPEVFGLGAGPASDAAARAAVGGSSKDLSGDPFASSATGRVDDRAPLDPFGDFSGPDPSESWEIETTVERPSAAPAGRDPYATLAPDDTSAEDTSAEDAVVAWSTASADGSSTASGTLLDELDDIFASPSAGPSRAPPAATDAFALFDEPSLPVVFGLPGESGPREERSDLSDRTRGGADPFLDPDLLASPGLLDLNPLDEHGQEVLSSVSRAPDEGDDLEELELRDLVEEDDTDEPGAVPPVRPAPVGNEGFALLDEQPLLGGPREWEEIATAGGGQNDFVSDAGTRPGPVRPSVVSARLPARVRLQYEDAESFVAEYRENLRRGGTFIRTERPLPVGRECLFEVGFPGLSEPLVFPALVTFVATAATGREAGMGVEYRLDARERAHIEQVLNRF